MLIIIWSSSQKKPFALRINCGGKTIVDRFGVLWQADDYYFGGVFDDKEGLYNISNIPDQDDTLYLSNRNVLSGSYRYVFPIPPGLYNVSIYTVAFSPATLFDVVSQGIKVIDRLDVYNEAGSSSNTAMTRSFNSTVGGNWTNLTLSFVAIPSRYVVVSAIEVQRM